MGNFGDGTINAYDPTTGAFLGRLADETGEAIHIDGLLGLHFGNGTASGDRNALYFAAAPDGGDHGLFGSLRVAPAQVESVVVNDGSAQRSMVKQPHRHLRRPRDPRRRAPSSCAGRTAAWST